MRSQTEMMFLSNLMNEKHCEAQLRSQIQIQLTGLKYWLYLLGF